MPTINNEISRMCYFIRTLLCRFSAFTPYFGNRSRWFFTRLNHHIEFVDSLEDFFAFAKAGRKLAELHLNYESVPPWKGLAINGGTPVKDFMGGDSLFKVGTKKMKIDPELRTMISSDLITIGNIPEEAFEYVVNGRSALGWIAEMYHMTEVKDTGIVNDSNRYAGSRHIFDLICSVVTVGVETVRIQKSLPGSSFGDDE